MGNVIEIRGISKYRNYFKDKSGNFIITEFSKFNDAFNNIQYLRDNGYSFKKSEELKEGKWVRVFLETPSGFSNSNFL